MGEKLFNEARPHNRKYQLVIKVHKRKKAFLSWGGL